ncbi:Lrp/AsnC family transcriptional regulator [Rhizohabitans arisaemae]|uniref:Lrp/AsnC family transcriptional regulator n=1 Tax=Rhizohabitans arisaemae TaxID=2720610 RepID=UPI0024B16A9B|nr:Lrp/AsnC family transcriptional regulator [Rhizohabitans arisaemae]
MNDLDPLDRQILAALLVNGRASWTEISQLVGTSTSTVARRAQQLIADGLLCVTVAPHMEHSGPVDAFVVRLNCAPGSQLQVAGRLAQNPDVRFITIVTGSHDIVFELIASKRRALYTMLVDEVHRIPGVLRSQADLVMHTYKVSYDWSRQLLTTDVGDRSAVYVQHRCEAGHLDAMDMDILGILGVEGRAGFLSVAKRLGVTESTVRRRFDSMIERGCAAVASFAPPAALGYEAEVLFWLAVEPGHLDEIAATLHRHPGVRLILATLGESSMLCEVIMPTTVDLHHFTSRTLGRIPGIRSWTADIQILNVKRGFLTTPWSRDRIDAALAGPDTTPTAQDGPRMASDVL